LGLKKATLIFENAYLIFISLIAYYIKKCILNKTMKTLIYQPPSIELYKALKANKKIEIKFSINELDPAQKDIDTMDLTKYNFPDKYEFEVSDESQKYYEDFYQKNFTIFSYQFVRRGPKILDVHELRNWFSYYFHNFFKILKEKKIELIIFFSFPHEGPDFLVYKLSKILNIKTICMHPSIIPDRYFTVESFDELGRFKNDVNIKNDVKNINIQNIEEIYVDRIKFRNKLRKQRLSKRLSKRLSWGDIFSIKFLKDVIRDCLIKLKLIYRENEKFLYKNYLENLKKIEKSKEEIFDLVQGRKIIFFPLHMQPELTTSLLGGIYEDQILVLEKLNSLSKDRWIIIAKENQSQTHYQRNSFFFKRLKGLKNVFFLNRNENTKEFLDQSDMTATICGTIGFEGLLKSKKCLVFGHAWYKNIHGALKTNNSISEQQINDFFNEQFDKSKFINDLQKLLSTCDKGVISNHGRSMNNYDENLNCTQIIKNLNKFIEKNFE
tara:strand:+ start:534 stop:2018 length:1485 start_codon:yes stop_codon:yes gene_type:complete